MNHSFAFKGRLTYLIVKISVDQIISVPLQSNLTFTAHRSAQLPRKSTNITFEENITPQRALYCCIRIENHIASIIKIS